MNTTDLVRRPVKQQASHAGTDTLSRPRVENKIKYNER